MIEDPKSTPGICSYSCRIVDGKVVDLWIAPWVNPSVKKRIEENK